MAAKNEVSARRGVLMSLFNKPKTDYVGKEGEEITVTPQLSDMVFIRNCKQCKFTVRDKAAKCMIESSSDVQVEFEEPLMTGTLELISSKGVTITIRQQDKLPTITAERCEDVHFHFHDPRSMRSIYTVKCSNIFVHLQPPFPSEMSIQLPPPEDSNDQWVSTYAPQGKKMTTARVIREGAGYATTEEALKQAQLREKEIQRQFEAYLSRVITISAKPKPASNQSQPKPSPAVQSSTTPYSAATPTSTATPPTKSESTEPTVESSKVTHPPSSPDDAPTQSPLAAALKAKKGDLKPTETVERQLPVVGVGRGGNGRGLTNIKDDDEKKEYFDSEEEFSKKLDKVVKWMKESKHIILFTGAGVSTSCGIPDFRSGMKTVLSTGPGVWELMAHDTSRPKGATIKPILQALPSPTHMAMVKLHEEGLAKFTISQNVDGLHRRSGLPASELAELHGNTNLETCQQCGRQYFRDFETREAGGVFDHVTSRLCDDPECRGVLHDSIVNFGENLPESELTSAMEHSKKADLCIVLGSSLRVRPACLMPKMVVDNRGKLVICNLQKIPHHPPGPREMQVFAKCDDFMSALMQRLGQEIPHFQLKRRVQVTSSSASGDGQSLCVAVTGLDNHSHKPYSFIKGIEVGGVIAGEEPLKVTVPSSAAQPSEEDATPTLSVTIYFHGHYNEPPVVLRCPLGQTSVFDLSYDVTGVQGGWAVSKKDN